MTTMHHSASLPEVWNAGFPGDTTVELLRRFERDVASKQPDLVILWAGVNDMLYPGHTVPEAVFQRNYRFLVSRCTAIGASVLAGTLPPQIEPYLIEQFPGVAEFPDSPGERIARGNALLEELDLPTADFGAVVRSRPVAETADSFLRNESNSRMRDGLHLTAAGCEAIARCALDAIERYHLPSSRVVCFGDSLTYGVYLRGRGTARTGAETYPAKLLELLLLRHAHREEGAGKNLTSRIQPE